MNGICIKFISNFFSKFVSKLASKFVLLLTAFFIFYIPGSMAECRDAQAFEAANNKALSYFKNATVFKAAVVQKNHHTSGNKEVASYIKSADKHYSIFTLIDADCNAKFRKRSRQWD